MGCKKQDITPKASELPPPLLTTQDIHTTIDSLQYLGFFTKNRPNPDMPVQTIGANYSSFTQPMAGPTITTITRNDVTLGTGDHPTWSHMQAVYNLFTAADKELFEMYNGYAEAYSNFLADRKYGTLSDDVFDQNLQEVKSTSTTSSHLIYIENWRSAGVIDRLSTIKMSGLFYDLYDSQNDIINPPSTIRLESVSNISWENIAKAGLGKLGMNSSPDLFTHWRNNLTISFMPQAPNIADMFTWYINL